MTTPKIVPVPAAARANGVSGASPLGSARYVVSQLLSDLEVTQSHLDNLLVETQGRAVALGEALDDAEVIRRHALRFLHHLEPAEVEQAFERCAALRAELAVVEERIGGLEARRQAGAEELEALSSVHRSLEEVADPVVESAADGAARFRSASRQVFQIVEEERMRIARDLHDGPAQTMANLVLQAEVLERLADRDPELLTAEMADFKSGVRSALEETRRLIFDLRPMTLDDLGLVPTLRRFVREFGDKTGIAARFHLVGEERRLAVNYEGVLFRIVQESLTNVRKHAGARSVEVVLTLQPRRVSALVRDDGEGFDVAATEARQGRTRHLGLLSMRERADLEKGTLEIRSEIGRGTEARVSFDI